MKQLLLAVVLLNLMTQNYAVIVELPNAQELSKRLQDIEFTYFMENTKIVEKLASKKAGKKMEALDVAYRVDQAYDCYRKHLVSKGLSEYVIYEAMDFVKMKRPKLLGAILKDWPTALQELRKHNVLTYNS